MEVYDDESSEGNERTRGVEHALLNCVSRARDCRDGADREVKQKLVFKRHGLYLFPDLKRMADQESVGRKT